MFLRCTLLSICVLGCAPEEGSSGRPSFVPEWAEEIEPDVYSIGTEIDPVSGEEVEGWVMVERLHDDRDLPSQAKRPGSAVCWSTLGAAGWATPESWGFDPTNNSGISESDAQAVFETAHATWEAAAGVDIFGSYTDTNLYTDVTGLDGENNLRFGDPGPGILAYANVWWSGGGPPSSRHVYEWDVVMRDNATKVFSVSGEAWYYDLENAAAHEFGHAVGLGHPSSTCTDETMYSSIGAGETKKRDLNTGDIAGVESLY